MNAIVASNRTLRLLKFHFWHPNHVHGNEHWYIAFWKILLNFQWDWHITMRVHVSFYNLKCLSQYLLTLATWGDSPSGLILQPPKANCSFSKRKEVCWKLLLGLSFLTTFDACKTYFSTLISYLYLFVFMALVHLKL